MKELELDQIEHVSGAQLAPLPGPDLWSNPYLIPVTRSPHPLSSPYPLPAPYPSIPTESF